MKEYRPEELEKENKEIFEVINYGCVTAISGILKDVEKELKGKPMGEAVIHACFMRLEDDKTKQVIYVEVETLFINVIMACVARVHKITIHDNAEEYEAARMATEKQKMPKIERLPNGTNVNMN